MKWLTLLVFSLAGCAGVPSEEVAYAAYEVCQAENQVMKRNEDGSYVLVKREGILSPVHIPDPEACGEENKAWNRARDLEERRATREREKPHCPAPYILVCDRTCGCASQEEMRRMLSPYPF